MCGIAGLFSTDLGADVRVGLEKLTTALAHRGPDGCGYQYFRGASGGFGHRRLSIVDIQSGAQPMSNEDHSIWVVFNGEIYNHLTLRAELERLGHVFRTHADTEVIVHGWEEWGTGVLGRLNGMFAIALHDARVGAGSVWLARDPVGVKPLYMGRNSHVWWFASELQAARLSGLVDGELLPEELAQFLVYRFIPAPATPFRGAWKVPAGHYCQVDLGSPLGEPRFQPFAYQPTNESSPTTVPGWKEALRAGVWEAVDRQLMSDVPLGTLLSGGVDSTLITRVMVERLGPTLGFAIGFESAPDGGELALARRAASALGISLIETAVAQAEFLSAWPTQIASFGEPVANSGVLLVGMLCRAVRESRKVVLTGQGADEPFGGYPRHMAERFYSLSRPLRHLFATVPPVWGDSDQWLRFSRMLGAHSTAERFTELLAVFSPADTSRLMRGVVPAEHLVAPTRRSMPGDSTDDPMNDLLVVDRRLSLSDDLLLVMDHMAMASSVEARVPFLDLELLSLVERMPSRLKVSRLGERKWLYRKAIDGDLPPSVRRGLTGWRARLGRKLGFTTPLGAWCQEWTGTHAATYFTGGGARLPEYLNGDVLNAFVALASRHPRRHQRQILSLYVLETWLRGLTR